MDANITTNQLKQNVLLGLFVLIIVLLLAKLVFDKTGQTIEAAKSVKQVVSSIKTVGKVIDLLEEDKNKTEFLQEN